MKLSFFVFYSLLTSALSYGSAQTFSYYITENGQSLVIKVGKHIAPTREAFVKTAHCEGLLEVEKALKNAQKNDSKEVHIFIENSIKVEVSRVRCFGFMGAHMGFSSGLRQPISYQEVSLLEALKYIEARNPLKNKKQLRGGFLPLIKSKKPREQKKLPEV